jgi:Raf kinase inhibitor-like YbhB/YbcL family protein
MTFLNWITPCLVTLSITAPVITVLAASKLQVSSPGYTMGATLPKKYTCDGAGLSPALDFKNLPAGTKSLAILGWDDNTSAPPVSTWSAYDIQLGSSKTSGSVPEGVPHGANVRGFKQGVNSFKQTGFSAPCPNKDGQKREYYIDFYAIDVSSLGLKPGADSAQVHAAIKKHKLEEAKLLGVYARK